MLFVFPLFGFLQSFLNINKQEFKKKLKPRFFSSFALTKTLRNI